MSDLPGSPVKTTTSTNVAYEMINQGPCGPEGYEQGYTLTSIEATYDVPSVPQSIPPPCKIGQDDEEEEEEEDEERIYEAIPAEK